MPEMSLVLATRNHGKITEFKELLAEYDMEIRSLLDFGPLPPVVEDGKPIGTPPKHNTRLHHPGSAAARGFGAVAFRFFPAARHRTFTRRRVKNP